MAIYHLTTRSFSRGKGSRAVAKYDYISREGKYSSKRAEVLFAQSANLPGWAENCRSFWAAADHFERRNGRLGREVEVALPAELSDEGKVILARRLTQEITGGRHPYTLAVHKGLASQGDNPHMHLIFSERTLDGIERSAPAFFRRANSKTPERGGAKKERAFISEAWLINVRKRWAELANGALEREGKEASIDHRSLRDQGIDRTPQQHLGPKVVAMEKRLRRTDRGHEVVAQMKASESTREHYIAALEEVNHELQRLDRSRQAARAR